VVTDRHGGTLSTLDRFLLAQAAQPWTVALDELRAGRKATHWIWWVFPQLGGLGRSTTAVRFGLVGASEAEAYVAHPELSARMLAALDALLEHRHRSLVHVMGGDAGRDVDALKLVSCATLFREVGRRLDRSEVVARCEAVLAWASEEGYPPCARTMRALTEPA